MTSSKLLIALVTSIFLAVGWLILHDLQIFKQPSALSLAFLPGRLSKAHAFLENQCTACHTPNQGVKSVGCISCHANNGNLLSRQPTAFHASVTSCKECHQEHQGGTKPPLLMDHFALAKLGARTHDPKTTDIQNQIVRNYLQQKHSNDLESQVVSLNSHEPPIVSSLDCMSCHSTRDRHQGQFGKSCLSCHATDTWRISEYKHPSPNSRVCSQCHVPPPSHYMMHFKMISMKFAEQEKANVNQCFLCHQTTSWNDIKGKGWYKHH